MQAHELRPPSFRKGRNAIPDVPSRLENGRLWILRGSASSAGLTGMGLAAAAMPALMGLAMADHRPAMLTAFGASVVVIGFLLLAQARGWHEFLVADSTRRVILTTRMRRGAPLWLIRHEPGWGSRIVLVRRVRPLMMYYRRFSLKPGDTVESHHGPAMINDVVHEVRLSGQGVQAVRVLPGGEPSDGKRVRGDATPPLVGLRNARPAQVAQLRELAVRLAGHMGLGFMDHSEELSAFERELPEGWHGIQHVAIPIPGENAPSWAEDGSGQ